MRSALFALVPLLLLVACDSSSAAPTPAASTKPFDWCAAGTAPDETCFAAKRDPTSANIALATSIAQRQMTLHPKANLDWNWGESVQMQSFIDLHRVANAPPMLQWVRSWLDGHIAGGYAISSSDTAASVGADVAVWKLTGDASYRKPIDDFLYYIDHIALKTPEGGLNHMGDSDLLGVAMWVDTLFMIGQPLIRLSLATGDAAPLDAMGKQLSVFIDQLQDPTGFFHHASENALKQDPDVFWGRGNGWVVWSLADYLRARKLRGEQDAKAEAALHKLAAAVVASQDAATGLWWTVLNRPGETYLETSATALFAAGLARGWRIGVLGNEVLPVIAKAMAAVKAKVVNGADGPVVTGVSGPTSAGTFNTYKAIKVQDDLSYGMGAVVLALIETSGLPAK